jgi:hypothetical protein
LKTVVAVQIDFAWICPLIRFLHFLPDVRIALPEPRVLRVRRVADYPLSFFDLHVDSFPAQTIPSALIASAHPVKLIGATPTQATALRMIRLTLQVGKVTVTYTVGAARYITQSLETPVPTPPPPAAPIFLYTAGPPFIPRSSSERAGTASGAKISPTVPRTFYNQSVRTPSYLATPERHVDRPTFHGAGISDLPMERSQFARSNG